MNIADWLNSFLGHFSPRSFDWLVLLYFFLSSLFFGGGVTLMILRSYSEYDFQKLVLLVHFMGSHEVLVLNESLCMQFMCSICWIIMQLFLPNLSETVLPLISLEIILEVINTAKYILIIRFCLWPRISRILANYILSLRDRKRPGAFML